MFYVALRYIELWADIKWALMKVIWEWQKVVFFFENKNSFHCRVTHDNKARPLKIVGTCKVFEQAFILIELLFLLICASIWVQTFARICLSTPLWIHHHLWFSARLICRQNSFLQLFFSMESPRALNMDTQWKFIVVWSSNECFSVVTRRIC
jgi:hypothetical protein